ncbi:PDR/VanB family oxidoreductase [Aquibium pacificus]
MAAPERGEAAGNRAAAYDPPDLERRTVNMEHGAGFDLAPPATQAVLVGRVEKLTADIVAIELCPEHGRELLAFTAGSHVDLHLPNGLRRSYSLVNDPAERHRYRLAVKREPGGRGGSAHIHDLLDVGHRLEVSRPRNNFLLEERASCSVLFAGGIGVTPLLSMALRLCRLGRPFHFHYGARSRQDAAFVDDLRKLPLPEGSTVRLHFEDAGGGPIDFRAIADAAPDGSHFYCCGPGPMIAAFETQLAHVQPSRLHREHFTGETVSAPQGGFEVVLAKSGRSIVVPEGVTILDALLDEGVEVDFSCMEGFCGSCRVAVLEGSLNHHDTVLSPGERSSGKVMMICCSTAAGERLVLDI